jgi:hypothetical protein
LTSASAWAARLLAAVSSASASRCYLACFVLGVLADLAGFNAAVYRLAITEFPILRALAPALASYDGAAELERFVDLLLPGLNASLTHPDISHRTN